MRTAHNSFARPRSFEMDNSHKQDDDDEDLFHFISYIPHNGGIYELDGLQPSPIYHGPIVDSDNWVESAKPVITRRIEKYMNQEIRFSLMAVAKDHLRSDKLHLSDLESHPDAVNLQMISDLKVRIQDEEEKRADQKKENERRRHNFLPLIIEMLKCMAEKNILGEYIKS